MLFNLQGEFYHWVDLFNHFEVFFEQHVKPRKDLQLEGEFLEGDGPFPKEAVLQVLRVTRIILENCVNKYLYSSNEVLYGVMPAVLLSISSIFFYNIKGFRRLDLCMHDARVL